MKTTRPVFPTPAQAFTTARLLLRPMQLHDLQDFYILRTQLEVMKWTSTTKTDVDEAFTRTWMDRYLPPNDAKTFNFAIEELSSPGKVIGIVGSHIAEPPEIGYMLRSETWGRGYATEAVVAWLQVYWALPRKEVEFETLSEDGSFRSSNESLREVLKADIDDKNIGSKTILEKCGFRCGAREEIEENGGIVTIATYYLERPS